MASKTVEIGGKQVGKLKASWLLLKESLRFLRADSEMLFIPIVTALLSILLFIGLCLITFVVAWGGSVETFVSWAEVQAQTETESNEGMAYAYVFIFLMYVISAYTLALSQAGIAHIVYTRVHGGNATLGQGLRSAFSHSFSLLLWAVITSTVGLILQMIAERSRLFARIIASLIGAAWNVLTYFVVPAMVIDKKSAFASIGKSVEVFKKTWGETLVTNISLGAAFTLVSVLFIIACVGLIILGAVVSSIGLMIFGTTVLVVGTFALALIQATLNGVIKTLLYVYASENITPTNFNQELLDKMLSRTAVPLQTVPLNTPNTFVGN